MGLSISLSNALSGMNTSQNSLDVLSRNVAGAGTPGYHRQSLTVVDTMGVNSTYARSGTIQRAFNESLQSYYTRAVSDASYSSVRGSILERLQSFLGTPGSAGSLDTAFAKFQTALQQLGTSPENYATRASVVAQAQGLAATLNTLTNQVQELRQETETRIAGNVDALNTAVGALSKINTRLADQTSDGGSRAALLDQRDRLVEQISTMIDLRVDYRSDGTVGLMTRSGVGILDGKPSIFEFQSAGALSASQQFNVDPARSGVGTLILRTPGGVTLDLVQQNALKSGELAGLVELRDKTLTAVQGQLDEIAGGLAQALSTVTTPGTPASSGAAQGFSLDLSGIRDGNDFVVDYRQNGVDKSLRVVRVDDPAKLPLDYLDANGTRVLGLDFSAGTASIASRITAALGPGFSVSNPSGNVLQVLDDGAANTTTVMALTKRTTSTGVQTGSPGLNLFVDAGNADYTGSLSGVGQQRGFAGRIAVNTAVLADNKLLVQYQAGLSLGDGTRPNYLLEHLETMRFASGQSGVGAAGNFRLGGNVSEIIAQALDYQGSVAEAAASDQATQELTMQTLGARLDSEYGVNVDEEMARLMELQNAYAANARVISVVQDLLDRLLDL